MRRRDRHCAGFGLSLVPHIRTRSIIVAGKQTYFWLWQLPEIDINAKKILTTTFATAILSGPSTDDPTEETKMSDRKKRMTAEYRSDGAHFTIYNDGEPDHQTVAAEVHRDVAGAPSLAQYRPHLLGRGYGDVLSQRGNKHFGADLVAIEQKLWHDMTTGAWQPELGRGGREPSQPSPLAFAISEVTGKRTPSEIQDDLDTRIQLNEDGSPRRDARGRTMRVWTEAAKAKLLVDYPQVAVVVARIEREHADKLAREAKAAGKAAPSHGLSLDTIFSPQAMAAADEGEDQDEAAE